MSLLHTLKYLMIMNNYFNCFGEELKAKARPKLRPGKSINCLSRLKGVTQLNRPNSKFTRGKTQNNEWILGNCETKKKCVLMTKGVILVSGDS